MTSAARATAAGALAFALLAACARDQSYGHWVGALTPTTPGPTCEPSRATLEVDRNGNVQFAPSEGTWILTGAIAPSGSLIAARTQPGADKQPYVTRLDAKVTADAIKGTYATPRCRFDVALAPRR